MTEERSFNDIAYDIVQAAPQVEPLVEEWFVTLSAVGRRRDLREQGLVEQYQTALDRLWEAHDQLCGCDKPADEGRCSAPEETWGAFEYLGERERDSFPASSPRFDTSLDPILPSDLASPAKRSD